MRQRVLYCGDTTLANAAAYLAGMMTAWNWEYDYIPSDVPLSESSLCDEISLFILSDYPASRIPHSLQESIRRQVENGAGLIMLGGWESFQGCGGQWSETVIGDMLPVKISSVDDRVNCDCAVYVRPRYLSHPITVELPWEAQPPIIGGFNRATPKPDSTVVLDSVRVYATMKNDSAEFAIGETSPLLVTGMHGMGRTAAFLSDVAPHWIGPMVDWGTPRVRAQAPGAEPIEVGKYYADFFRQLLEFVKRPD